MRTTTGRDKAARYLSALLSRPQSGDCRLPPVRALAKAAGVSLVTMVKAVHELRLQGRIETIHGKSVRAIRPAGGPAAASQKPAPSIKLWQSIRRDLERSILTGACDRSAALPSLKEMKNRFGASYRTLKKALDYLRAQGTIERYGRGYRAARHANPAGRYEILIFIYREDETLSLSYLDPHLIRHIESICRQAGAAATFIRYVRIKGETFYANHLTGKPWKQQSADRVLGCMWIVLFPEEIVDDCCQRLLKTGKPVAVFEGRGAHAFPSFFADNHRVKFFAGGDTELPGRIVGSYLTRLGHRRCAFFTCTFHREWAQARLRGLEKVVAKTGAGSSVSAFTVDNPGAHYSLPRTWQELARQIFAAASQAIPQPSAARQDRLTAVLERAASEGLGEGYYHWVLERELEPLFMRALADANITAWVFGDDTEAIIGLDFLKRNRTAVPGRISVVGFNNSQAALAADLTSYNNDFEAVMNAMLNYLLRPDSGSDVYAGKEVVLDGYVVERRTSAAIRH
jgi:DNA-binding LacI/PurR family transcriptional regulator/DNA-binding transcriptional regulator YhcF (GntR family)